MRYSPCSVPLAPSLSFDQVRPPSALLKLRPGERRILFKHIGGITRGMDVEWRLEPEGDSTRVTISHELSYPVPLLGPLFARFVVGDLFVRNIAGKTLACIKQIVEAEALAASW